MRCGNLSEEWGQRNSGKTESGRIGGDELQAGLTLCKCTKSIADALYSWQKSIPIMMSAK